MSKLHSSVRYSSADRTCQGVEHEDLNHHIEYNSTFRFGQSLFIDGVCLYHSFYHTNEQIEAWTIELKDKPFIPQKCIKPYH